MSDSKRSDWQQVIWREWRNCDDPDLAEQLFALVAGRPVGPGATASIIFLGALYGAAVGLLLGLFVPKNGVLSGLLPDNATLFLSWLLGGSVGAGLGLLVRFGLGARFSWWQWLERLSPRMVHHPFRLEGDRGTILTLGVLLGFVAGPVGGLLVGLFYAGMAGARRNSEQQGFASPGETILLGVLGGTLSIVAIPLFFLAVASFTNVGAAAILILFVSLTVQGIGLVFGIDFGLLGGLLFGLLGGTLSGILANLVVGPALGLVAGATVLLVNGLFSVIRTSPYAWTWRGLWAWWHSRPEPQELELALQQAVQVQKQGLPVWPNALRELAKNKMEPGPAKALVKALSSRHWQSRFLAAHTLVSVGGEAVPALQAVVRDRPLSRASAWLLRSIASDTQHRLASRSGELLCPRCLVRFAALPISVPGPDLTYYGCRACGQSREILEWPGEVVAVLDEEMGEEQVKAGNSLRVNWLARQELFDFDRVEIIRASDEEVERFAVAVGNDTDRVRKARYQKASCYVASGCSLTENTRRVLDQMFGRVGGVL